MKTQLFLYVTAALLFSSCASNKMLNRENQAIAVPTSDKAQVIFMRPSSFGGAIQSTVFDISASEPSFFGIVATGTQISIMVDPGKHVFMVVSEAADFLEADLAAGKTYFAIVTARFGAWKARFSMYPVRNRAPDEYQYDSEKFQGWQENVRFFDNTPDSIAWFEANRTDIKEKQNTGKFGSGNRRQNSQKEHCTLTTGSSNICEVRRA